MNPKTLKASELINLIQDGIKEFGDLPVYITDGQGELSLNESCIRLSDRVGYKDKRTDKTIKQTLNGRFFILSDL